MAERTVRIRSFAYTEEVPHPTNPNKTVIRRRRVARGETHDFPAAAIKEGEAFGAFVTEEDEAAAEEEATPNFESADADEIAEWIIESKPTVNEVLDATGGSPAVAQKMLDAENIATGNDPRSTLVEGLAEIVNRGGQ